MIEESMIESSLISVSHRIIEFIILQFFPIVTPLEIYEFSIKDS